MRVDAWVLTWYLLGLQLPTPSIAVPNGKSLYMEPRTLLME